MAEPRIVVGFCPSRAHNQEYDSLPSVVSSPSTPHSPLTEALKRPLAHETYMRTIRTHRRTVSCQDPNWDLQSHRSDSSSSSAIPIPHSRRSSTTCSSPGSSFRSQQQCISLPCRSSLMRDMVAQEQTMQKTDVDLNWEEDLFEMEMPCPAFAHVQGLKVKIGRSKSKLSLQK